MHGGLYACMGPPSRTLTFNNFLFSNTKSKTNNNNNNNKINGNFNGNPQSGSSIHCFQIELKFRNVVFCGGRETEMETGVPGEKPLEQG